MTTKIRFLSLRKYRSVGDVSTPCQISDKAVIDPIDIKRQGCPILDQPRPAFQFILDRREIPKPTCQANSNADNDTYHFDFHS